MTTLSSVYSLQSKICDIITSLDPIVVQYATYTNVTCNLSLAILEMYFNHCPKDV